MRRPTSSINVSMSARNCAAAPSTPMRRPLTWSDQLKVATYQVSPRRRDRGRVQRLFHDRAVVLEHPLVLGVREALVGPGLDHLRAGGAGAVLHPRLVRLAAVSSAA